MNNSRKLATLWVLAFAALASGCYTTTYYTGKKAGGAVHEEWNHRWVQGLIESGRPLNIDDICANGASEITTLVTAGNALASGAVQLGATVAIAVPIYQATRERGEDFFDWERDNRRHLDSIPHLWSPSTIQVRCAK
jgi:hypothetical protein